VPESDSGRVGSQTLAAERRGKERAMPTAMEGPAASGSVAEDSSAGSYVSISPRFAEMTSQRNSYSYEEAFSDEIG